MLDVNIGLIGLLIELPKVFFFVTIPYDRVWATIAL